MELDPNDSMLVPMSISFDPMIWDVVIFRSKLQVWKDFSSKKLQIQIANDTVTTSHSVQNTQDKIN